MLFYPSWTHGPIMAPKFKQNDTNLISKNHFPDGTLNCFTLALKLRGNHLLILNYTAKDLFIKL